MSSEKKRDVFFCPFKEVEIQNLYSEMLEKIGGLPMLILLQAAENKTVAEIADGICVADWVIDDTAEELVKTSLLIKQGEQYALTDLGRRYVRIYNFIKEYKANDQNRHAVNLFTCQLEQVKNERFFENTMRPEKEKFPIKLQNAERFIKTPNFENTLDYMKEYMEKDSVLDDNDYQYFQFELKAKGEVFFVPYYVPDDYFVDESDRQLEENLVRHDVWLNVPVFEGKRIYRYTGVSEEIAGALQNLNSIAPEFLTEDGKTHVKRIEQAKLYTQKCNLCVIDAYSGKKYRSENGRQTVDILPKGLMQLSKRYVFPAEPERAKILDGEFYYHYEVVKEYTVPVSIDFSRFEQCEEDEP